MVEILISEEKDEIMDILKKNNIESLWHYTDIKNLPLIKILNGLRSKEYLERNRYWGRKNEIFPGGDSISHALDRKLNNWDKISLNFTPYTPLAYHKKREKHLVFIEISPEVAGYRDVYFTDCNATRMRNSQEREKGRKGLQHVRFDMVHRAYEPQNQDWNKYVQAEVLVPHYIPKNMFKAVHFVSVASKKYGEFLWDEKCDIFQIEQETFHDTYSYKESVIQFPYIREVIISRREVSEENVHAIRTNADHLVQENFFWVIVHLYAIAGTRVSVDIREIKERRDKELESEGDCIWWQGFIVPKEIKWLQVKVFIDRIQWTHRRMRCLEGK
jgi:hypothetical protein